MVEVDCGYSGCSPITVTLWAKREVEDGGREGLTAGEIKALGLEEGG